MPSCMTFRAGTQDTVHARQPLYQHTIGVAIINTSLKKPYFMYISILPAGMYTMCEPDVVEAVREKRVPEAKVTGSWELNNR